MKKILSSLTLKLLVYPMASTHDFRACVTREDMSPYRTVRDWNFYTLDLNAIDVLEVDAEYSELVAINDLARNPYGIPPNLSINGINVFWLQNPWTKYISPQGSQMNHFRDAMDTYARMTGSWVWRWVIYLLDYQNRASKKHLYWRKS